MKLPHARRFPFRPIRGQGSGLLGVNRPIRIQIPAGTKVFSAKQMADKLLGLIGESGPELSSDG